MLQVDCTTLHTISLMVSATKPMMLAAIRMTMIQCSILAAREDRGSSSMRWKKLRHRLQHDVRGWSYPRVLNTHV